jgi:hypothetical protein
MPAETQHTPEPWIVAEMDLPFNRLSIRTSGGYGEIVSFPDWGFNTAANADRIVACVNACKGINPEAMPDLLKALQGTLAALNVAFSAEEDPFGVHHNDAQDAVSAAESAIRKATETK